jgi:molybdate transport system substrate-binding protein
MPISEILHAPGVDFAGSIASEIQFVQTFSAAVVAGSGDIERSKRLIEFLASERASEAIKSDYPGLGKSGIGSTAGRDRPRSLYVR